jgi:hypothetical protein
MAWQWLWQWYSYKGLVRKFAGVSQREKEVFLAYHFALHCYISRVSSRSKLLSTPVTKFGDPREATEAGFTFVMCAALPFVAAVEGETLEEWVYTPPHSLLKVMRVDGL